MNSLLSPLTQGLITAVLAVSASFVFAGNKINPDAIDLSPLPMPKECKINMEEVIDFDESTIVAVDCEEEAGVEWLGSHFKEWYGEFSPKVKAAAVDLQLLKGKEA